MDKFTVDLDQVLNDFEYSELTDQYNTVRPPISAPNHNNVTKHSINNVFHSLNEYLNTSIDITTVDSIGNNLNEGNVLKKVENVDAIKSKPAEDCVADRFCEDAGACGLDKNPAGEKFEYSAEEFSENLGDGDKKQLQDPDSSRSDQTDKKLTDYSKQSDIPTKEEYSSHITTEETINVAKEDTLILIDITNDNAELKIEEILSQDLEPAEPSPSIIKNDQENVPKEETNVLHEETVQANISNGEIVELNEEIVEVNASKEEIVEVNEGAVEVNASNEETVEANEETVEVNASNEEIVDAIGFKDVTDVDDDEIDNLLAELENDDDLIEQDLVMNEISDQHEVKCDSEDLSQPVEDATTEPSPMIIMKETVTKVAEQPQTSVVNKAEEIPTEKMNSEDSKQPEVTVEETQKEDVVLVEELDPKAETVLEKDQDEEKDEDEEEVEVQGEESKKKTEDQSENQEIVNRPKHLPLKESGDDRQREINLIGGPGSTPYNNVYISEEISKNRERDNESISSTSSNTYSDSGSTASTASTEEIRDDNETNNTNITEQSGTPKENVERGSRELSDDLEARNAPEETSETSEGQIARSSGDGERQWLGKEAPLWIPDSDTASCLHCDMKFTVLKRRHHCRACGLVLCSKCCHLRFKLEYLDAEARVCNKCHDILNKDTNSSSSSEMSTPDPGNSPLRRPNPNNPLEYCSTVSPLQQVSGASSVPLPAVMVPVGVLKRKGSNKAKSNKSVMFCDGIRPGSDLTNLDNDFNYNNTKTKKLEKTSTTASAGKINRNLPLIDSETNSFIPKSENSLPPLVTITKSDITYTDCQNNPAIVDQMKNDEVTFAILLSLYVHAKIINMNCCINKTAWCFTTEGLINVGQDEIVIILEYIDDEAFVPKDIFYHINNIYADAVKGTSIKELGISLHNSSNFLDSKNHAGFVYIRPTFQCLENVIKPKETFLIGILIHRWETPWAKLFPLRLILRLGAEYRYYPSPVISTRHRESVFVEIGHTIINLLADFRNFSYTLPQIGGLSIHMEDKNTTVTIPVNRYDQVIKSLNNSSDHILAFGGSFSQDADSHLVCIQDTQGNENCYSTHAINIQNKPRKVTGASFIVFNGALKSSSGLTAKSNIVEDGLMIQVLPEHMQQIRDNLRAMKNHTIPCGCVNAATDETVNIVWGDNDTNFNIGVTSSIDGMSLSGIPSIRVHNGKNHYGANGNRIIRWTEVFIIQNGDENPKNQDPVDVSKISENIAKATCDALLNYLDLLVTNNFQKIGIRTTLHVDSVSYCAGSNNMKLPPIYMKSLDNELIPVLHRITSGNLGENAIILELIFRILNV